MKRCVSSAALHFSLFIVLLVSIRTNAQDRSLDTLYAYQPAFTSSDAVLNLTGEGSFLHNNDKTGITDDVLLYPGWQKGIVNFRNGKQAMDIELKFNLLRN